jgi:hypothetical protein
MWICTRGTKASPWSMPRPAMPRRFGPRQALPIPHTARRPDESLIDSGFGVSLLDTVLVHDPTAPGDRVLLEAGDPYRDACSTLQGFAMFLGVDRRSHGRLRRPGGFCPRLTGISISLTLTPTIVVSGAWGMRSGIETAPSRSGLSRTVDCPGSQSASNVLRVRFRSAAAFVSGLSPT